MRRKVVAFWVSLVMILSLFVIIIDYVPPVRGVTIIVDDDGPADYSTIQEAVDAANPGDTVFVKNGTYVENVVINKMINLTGEDVNTTIIDANGIGEVVYISSSSVNINGFTITNSGSSSSNAGVTIDSVNNCKIMNNNISNNKYGIHLTSNSDNNIISDNIISSNGHDGIWLFYSDGNIISNNTITSSTYDGIDISDSLSNTIFNNTIISNGNNGIELHPFSDFNNLYDNYLSLNEWDSIYIGSGSSNTLSNNEMLDSGIYISGINLEDWNTHTIDTTNTVNGRPVYYWKNQMVGTVPLNAGQVILANCQNVFVADQNISEINFGILLGFSNNNFILNNILHQSRGGIFLCYSSENTIDNNDIFDNFYGMMTNTASNNTISNNDISRLNYFIILDYDSNDNLITNNNIIDNINGINLDDSFRNIISNNIFLDNYRCISLWLSTNNFIENNMFSNNSCIKVERYSHYTSITNNNFSNNGGVILIDESTNCFVDKNIIHYNLGRIYLRDSSNNIISNNSIFSNENNGIDLSFNCEENIIFNNDIINNGNYGLYIISHRNLIYHNNFINNTYQAYDSGNDNLWNNTYPTGGNYWSDFDEAMEGAFDDYQGIGQNISGNDGIIDNGTKGIMGMNPYEIDSDSRDQYPLFNQIGDFEYLNPGWNFISIQFIQSNTKLDSVFSSINGYYDAVQYYDITDFSEPWKHNYSNKPLHLNDLENIDHKVGFWIHITNSNGTIFRYDGVQPSVNQTIDLYIGWNMVGYPSPTKYNRTNALNNLQFGPEIDTIQWFDSSTKTWHFLEEGDHFVPGRGYLIHSKVDTTWEVPL